MLVLAIGTLLVSPLFSFFDAVFTPATFFAQFQVSNTPRAASPTSQQPDNGPAQAVAIGLMEKLARQESLAESLPRQIDEFPLHDG